MPKSADTRRPHLVSHNAEKTQMATPPAPAQLAQAAIDGAGFSMRGKGCLQRRRRTTCGRSGATDTLVVQSRARWTICASRRSVGPPGGAVASPPHDPGCGFPQVRLRLPRLFERGSTQASVKTAAVGVYVVLICPLRNTGLLLRPSAASVPESKCVVGAVGFKPGG